MTVCPRCSRSHSGVCGIPPAKPKLDVGFSIGGLGFSMPTEQSSFRPGTVEHGDSRPITNRVGLLAIQAKIDKLEGIVSSLLSEASVDSAMAAEVEMLKQMIARLKEYV